MDGALGRDDHHELDGDELTPGRVSRVGDGAAGADYRIMPILHDANGARHRDYRHAVEHMEEARFLDFPIQGPRTMLWCAKFMLASGGTPRGWHSRWRSEGKLQAHDGGVAMHDSRWQVLELLLAYDQVNGANLAAAEMFMRLAHLLEQHWKERFVGIYTTDREHKLHSYLGGASRGNSCISPMLSEWIADELR